MTVNRLTTRPTLKQIAERAGVSTAAVSYVLSGRKGRTRPVSDETAERVRRAAAELAYVPSHAGRSLSRQRTDVVCLLRDTGSTPWVNALGDSLTDLAAEDGRHVIALMASRPDHVDLAVQLLVTGYADGVVVHTHEFTTEHAQAIASRGIPLVAFSEQLVPHGYDVVRHGEAAAVTSAIDHLVASGRRSVALFAHPWELVETEHPSRLAAARAALEAHGLAAREDWILPVAHSREDSLAAARVLLTGNDRPDAIFCTSDRSALAALWAAQADGVAVPDDLALVGVGNIEEGERVPPGLTTVGAATTDFTAIAARILDRLADRGPGLEEVISWPWELIERGTT
ncbi:transcriptional regulator, LacI family [Beutenbergia cavernae DSM 12333]|uniref:Transcriptional regulator, LacI family n=1 Tax=Beutenbergia cavernae (strain ATCC BAA-8 / DSM 12333 / CCUG 43141 / JCM 11478 / NBRC 16432 / NCIMB 13614 / HKI 0122) TaxID=471853 RepID=C5BXG6_BEUC1|nr:LacI family DNA-binding transcriptional regulator [Beutenbergia cavernae]ACQ80849.1 transcriptional regulator, LacI family [Beutenbergia cavernae DSM 12333]